MRGFQIKLDNNAGHDYYIGGQVISGRVLIDSNEEKKITGIKLKWAGGAGVDFFEAADLSKRRGRMYTDFGSAETYFNKEEFIYGSANGPPLTLQPGHQSFPFKFKLPNGLPSSFSHLEKSRGIVEYSVEVTIKRDWKSDFSKKLEFTVKGVVDLNSSPDADLATNSPRVYNEDKYLMLCCCLHNGRVGFGLHLERNGFLPGETLTFRAEMYNFSSTFIRKTLVSLFQNITFYAKGKHKCATQVIAREKGPELHPGEEKVWQSTKGLKIPETIPPTNLGGCRIMDVDYLLRMEIRTPFPWTECISLPVEIIIGTIPFRKKAGVEK